MVILLKTICILGIIIFGFLFFTLAIAIGVQVGLEMFYKYREFKG